MLGSFRLKEHAVLSLPALLNVTVGLQAEG